MTEDAPATRTSATRRLSAANAAVKLIAARVASEVSAHFVFLRCSELVGGRCGMELERGCVINVRLRLRGIDPWISR